VRDAIRFLLKHICDIQRPDVQVNTSTIRDRRVAKYDDIATSVPCWFEPGGVSYNSSDQFGQVPIKNFAVHFRKGVDVKEGDRLLKGSIYYLVQQVVDNSDQGFHVTCQVVEKKYAMS
jgi:hypothetical protein